MWTIAIDHYQRHWKMVALISFPTSLMVFSVDSTGGFYFDWPVAWILYANYLSVMSTCSQADRNSEVARVLRTLPLPKSELANLAWGMTAVAPPAFVCLIALPVKSVTFFFRESFSQWIAGPLLFLLLAILFGGVATFVRTLTGFERARVATVHSSFRALRFLPSYKTKSILLFACAVAAFLLMLFPVVTRWSDLRLSHLYGMSLAVWLTWKSYQMRSWLWKSQFLQTGRTRKASGSQGAPRYHKGAVGALRQDLRRRVQGSVIVVLAILGICYLIPFLSTSHVPALAVDRIFNSAARVAVFCILVGTVGAIAIQFESIQMLGVVRSLPLTSRQSVLLLLIYPFTVSLIAVPCAAVLIWTLGYGRLPALLVFGLPLGAAVCTFGLFLRARNGSREFTWILGIGSFFLGLLILVALQSKPQSMTLPAPLLCAGILILAALSVFGYSGLRNTIENDSDPYKREASPQQFGPGSGR